MSLSKEEQLKRDQQRGQQLYNSKDEGGFSGKQVLNLATIGGYKKELFYKPKEGVNRIDIVPYRVKTDKHPQGIERGGTDHILDLWVHRYVGPSKSTYVCLAKMFGKACPICEELDEELKDTTMSKEDRDSLNKKRAKRRCWYNVIDLTVPEKDQKVQIFEESHYLFEKEIIAKAGASKDGFVAYWNIDFGKSVEFRVTKKGTSNGSYNEYRIDEFVKRQPYDERILDESYSFDELYHVPTYEEVRSGFHGIDLDDDEPRNEEPRSSAQSYRKEESEPEESPRRRRREWDDDVKEEQQEDTQCPEGLRFGIDCDEKPACRRCPQEIWDKCAEIKDGKR